MNRRQLETNVIWYRKVTRLSFTIRCMYSLRGTVCFFSYRMHRRSNILDLGAKLRRRAKIRGSGRLGALYRVSSLIRSSEQIFWCQGIFTQSESTRRTFPEIAGLLYLFYSSAKILQWQKATFVSALDMQWQIPCRSGSRRLMTVGLFNWFDGNCSSVPFITTTVVLLTRLSITDLLQTKVCR